MCEILRKYLFHFTLQKILISEIKIAVPIFRKMKHNIGRCFIFLVRWLLTWVNFTKLNFRTKVAWIKLDSFSCSVIFFKTEMKFDQLRKSIMQQLMAEFWQCQDNETEVSHYLHEKFNSFFFPLSSSIYKMTKGI